MSADRNWRIRIEDILNSVNKIIFYTKDLDFEQFSNNELIIDAVIRNFEIIGEAAGHIPLTIQEKYPNLAWFEMRGMRNLVIHEYFGISLSIIWKAIQNDLPALATSLRELLDQENL